MMKSRNVQSLAKIQESNVGARHEFVQDKDEEAKKKTERYQLSSIGMTTYGQRNLFGTISPMMHSKPSLLSNFVTASDSKIPQKMLNTFMVPRWKLDYPTTLEPTSAENQKIKTKIAEYLDFTRSR